MLTKQEKAELIEQINALRPSETEAWTKKINLILDLVVAIINAQPEQAGDLKCVYCDQEYKWSAVVNHYIHAKHGYIDCKDELLANGVDEKDISNDVFFKQATPKPGDLMRTEQAEPQGLDKPTLPGWWWNNALGDWRACQVYEGSGINGNDWDYPVWADKKGSKWIKAQMPESGGEMAKFYDGWFISWNAKKYHYYILGNSLCKKYKYRALSEKSRIDKETSNNQEGFCKNCIKELHKLYPLDAQTNVESEG